MKTLKRMAAVFISFVIIGGCSSCSTPEQPEQLEQKTLDSLTFIADGIYSMDCYSDYKEEEYLNANITDVEQFDIWMTQNLTHGVPTGDVPEIGCSSFAVGGTLDSHLFGRNYDMKKGDSLILRNYPKDGYSSIGIVDLTHVNLGMNGEYDINDENGKYLLLAAPWCVCDGINEKGLGVSILELSNRHSVTDSEKGDLLLYSAIRLLLDRCASVDEAVALLDGYDIYSPRTNTYHLFITDTSGRSVVVEWADDKTYVIEDTAATNVMLNKENVFDIRYINIHKSIDDADWMTSEEAMELLKSVKQNTRWSAVYNLEGFSVDVCFNCDYENILSFSGK